MTLLNQLQQIFLTQDIKEFYKRIGLYAGVIVFLIVGTLYYYYTRTSDLHAALKKVNKDRQEVQHLLKKYKRVLEQKEAVNTMLEEEKNFKIQSFFDSVVQQHQLKGQQKQDAQVSEEVLYKRYTEIKLTAQFKQINTQELSELLRSIEEKKRVYIKDLAITKTKGAALDISLTIATLKSQSETKAR
jgi:hypothetical protein